MSQDEHGKLIVNLNPISLEADVAYFGARLEMVGKPRSSYQAAQLKVFQSLEQSIGETLQRLRGSNGSKK
jgi:hypothetical protein